MLAFELLPTYKAIGATGGGAPADGTDWNQRGITEDNEENKASALPN
jgi:hypothetical protein